MQATVDKSALTTELRTAYQGLIEERLGLRLSAPQAVALDDAVLDLLPRTSATTPHELYAALASEPASDLLDVLATHITIGETHFFRIAPQIQALQCKVLPDLIARRSPERRLSIWSAGCSTGEEPYTLAILLRETLPGPEDWDIQLLATDVNRPALAHARQALYSEWSFRDTPALVLTQYFTEEGKRLRLVDPVRRMVRYSYLNLAADVIPSSGDHGSSFDLIVCRNVTIYFSPETTQRLYRRFADALAPGGWLLLGPADPVPAQPGPLAPVYLPGVVLWQRPEAASRPAPAARPATYKKVDRPRIAAPVRARRNSESITTRRFPDPPANPAQAALGEARARGSDRVEVRVHAEQLVRTQPLDFEGHLLLGMMYLDEQATEQAIESFRRATFLDATHILAYFNLGQAYLQHGDRARAHTAFNHVRRLLAAAPDIQAIPGGGEMSANELRYALEAQLAGLGDTQSEAR